MKLHTNLAIENYRGAIYLNTISMISKFIKTFLFFLALAVVYLVLGQLGVIPYSQIINFIVTAYLVFMLFQFGRIELAIFRYSKKPDTLIGKDIIYTLYENHFTVELPHLGEKNNYSLDMVTNVVEMSTNFMIYMNERQLFIIPKNQFDEKMLSDIRTYFISHLKGRFTSRIFENANKAFKGGKKGFFG